MKLSKKPSKQNALRALMNTKDFLGQTRFCKKFILLVKAC